MFRFLLNFIGFLLSFVFTEKIMHEVWHLRNVIYSSIVRCHFKSIGKGGRFCYPLILNGGKNILIGDKFSLRERHREGTPPVEAAAVIVDLVRDMLHWKASGIKLNRRQAGDAGA